MVVHGSYDINLEMRIKAVTTICVLRVEDLSLENAEKTRGWANDRNGSMEEDGQDIMSTIRTPEVLLGRARFCKNYIKACRIGKGML